MWFWACTLCLVTGVANTYLGNDITRGAGHADGWLNVVVLALIEPLRDPNAWLQQGLWLVRIRNSMLFIMEFFIARRRLMRRYVCCDGICDRAWSGQQRPEISVLCRLMWFVIGICDRVWCVTERCEKSHWCRLMWNEMRHVIWCDAVCTNSWGGITWFMMRYVIGFDHWCVTDHFKIHWCSLMWYEMRYVIWRDAVFRNS